ncbi:DUF6542 domain-containing protein [Actinacidiphila sp. bgisy144]|uniref:DUF6542 domain-containing protein n=1 Tax=Actinacidiphila sp. bgisy144 TaxID=3413791 RepID=UPI003EBA8B8D
MEQHTARTSMTARTVPTAPAAPANTRTAAPRTANRPTPNPNQRPNQRPGKAPARPPGKPPAGTSSAALLTAATQRLRALPRPRPRLTGLGTGALTTVVTVLAGAADAFLFDGPGTFFGLVFVAVCIAAALYVRPYDLVAAPVAAPIAFAAAVTLTADGGDGSLVGHLVGVFTGLAMMTGWLYTGTVLAAAIVAVRALRQPSPRRRSRRCSGAPRGRSPR